MIQRQSYLPSRCYLRNKKQVLPVLYMYSSTPQRQHFECVIQCGDAEGGLSPGWLHRHLPYPWMPWTPPWAPPGTAIKAVGSCDARLSTFIPEGWFSVGYPLRMEPLRTDPLLAGIDTHKRIQRLLQRRVESLFLGPHPPMDVIWCYLKSTDYYKKTFTICK